MEFRMGINKRWQTKRGLAGQQRIIDWIVLDIDAVLFPDPARDNFGAGLGLVDYDFRWHVGDRLTLLSDGFFDVFDQGLRQVTVGALISRPEHGSCLCRLPLDRRTDHQQHAHRLAQLPHERKVDRHRRRDAGTFANTGNIGQNFALTRIGESFLLKVGFNYDASRDNFGVVFGIEPRFLPSSRLGRVGGVQIPHSGLGESSDRDLAPPAWAVSIQVLRLAERLSRIRDMSPTSRGRRRG